MRMNYVNKIIMRSYPNMTKEEYKKYCEIAIAHAIDGGRAIHKMHWTDFEVADEWYKGVKNGEKI